jgi:hypothetical protein
MGGSSFRVITHKKNIKFGVYSYMDMAFEPKEWIIKLDHERFTL